MKDICTRRRAMSAAGGLWLLSGLGGLAWPRQAAATEPFPGKMVRIVVPFPPGGSTDALARHIAEKLALRWKRPVVVENRPGANTILGTDVVAKSAADGHTLGIVAGSHSINPFLTSKLPYDTLKDLTGVTMLTRFQMALYAAPNFPAGNPRELMDLARRMDGKLAYGSATTQSYLAMELLNHMAKTSMQYVPYKGSAQAMSDLLGGHVQLLIDPVVPGAVEFARQGKLKIIAGLGTTPSVLTPSVPTIGSAVPGYDFSGVFGVIARHGTPAALLQHIRDEIAAVLRLPDVDERIRTIGQEPVGSTPAEYNQYILAEMRKWEPVIKATGARID